jgi:hypothetical protein
MKIIIPEKQGVIIMKRKGSWVADRIIQDKKKQDYFKRLADRMKNKEVINERNNSTKSDK